MKTFNKFKSVFLFGLALLALMISHYGCATILGDSNQVISVDSNVPGAEVFLNGKAIGETPLSTTVPKEADAKLEVKKEGYQSQTLEMTTSLTGAFWGNILIGGLLGSTTDQATHSAYEYDPGSYQIDLIPEQASQGELNSLMAEANLRRFILYNYTQIIREASSERGEHLDALSGLLLLKTDKEKSDLAANLFKFYGENSNPPEFAEKILVLARQSNAILQTGKDFR